MARSYDDDAEEIDLGSLKEIPMVEVLDLLGLEAPNSQGKVRSPFNPDERTPSCHIYDDHWFDYSSGKGGDPLDLVIAVTGKPWRTAARLLATGDFSRQPRAARVEELPDFTDRFHEGSVPFTQMQSADLGDFIGWVLRYWKGTIDLVALGAAQCRVSKDGYGLWIPHFDANGRVCGVKVRAVGAGAKTGFRGSKYPLLWEPSRSHRGIGHVALCEGETDAMALHKWASWRDISVKVVALPSGAGHLKAAMADQLGAESAVTIITDNDPAGEKARRTIDAELGARFPDLIINHLVPPHGDVVDSLAEGWTPW